MPEEKQLRDRVASGVAWSFGEKVGTILLQAVVSIVVARLLTPDDVGLMAIMTVFSSIAIVITDSGFSQMLIRREAPTQADYRAVFSFNIAASWVVYGALVALFPWIADFYGQPVLARIAPVLFLLVPINALCVIQNTLLVRQFRFATLSKITFLSSLLSGLAAVGMALAGCGVWSLVGQRVGAMAVRAALLWSLGRWRPRGRTTLAPLRAMAPYSLRLLATDLISNIYNRIAALFIGKIYSTDALGYFSQAQKLEELPVTSAVQSVQSVTFPAFTKLVGQPAKFDESYRQVLMIVAFALFPTMAGLSAVAHDLFALLLGERWMPTVPYFEVICLAGLFAPLTAVAYNVLKARSDGRIVVRTEIVKKVLMTVVLAVTIPRSVLAVTWGLVAMAALELVVNLAAGARCCGLPLRRIVRTLLPPALLTAAMYLAVRCVGDALPPAHPGLRLLVQVLCGAALYTLPAALLRLEAFALTRQIARRFLLRR